jgi:hypothetical protein
MRDEFGAIIDNRDRTCLIGRTISAGDGGFRRGRIVGILPGGGFETEFDGYTAYGRPIVVDLRRGEFKLERRVKA